MIFFALTIFLAWDHYVVTLVDGQKFDSIKMPAVSSSETRFLTSDGQYYCIANELVLNTQLAEPKTQYRIPKSRHRLSLSETLAGLEVNPKKRVLVITDDELEDYTQSDRRVVNDALESSRSMSGRGDISLSLAELKAEKRKGRQERARLKRDYDSATLRLRKLRQQRWELVTRPHDLGEEIPLDSRIASLERDIEEIDLALRSKR